MPLLFRLGSTRALAVQAQGGRRKVVRSILEKALREKTGINIHQGKTKWNKAIHDQCLDVRSPVGDPDVVVWRRDWALQQTKQGLKILGAPIGHEDVQLRWLLRGSTLRAPPVGAPPFGPHFFWEPPPSGPPFRGPTLCGLKIQHPKIGRNQVDRAHTNTPTNTHTHTHTHTNTHKHTQTHTNTHKHTVAVRGNRNVHYRNPVAGWRAGINCGCGQRGSRHDGSH